MNNRYLAKSIWTKKEGLFFFYFLLITYLIYGTAIVADSFTLIQTQDNIKEFVRKLRPVGTSVYTPILHYTHIIWLNFINHDNLFILNYIKVFYITLMFYMTSKFFSLFMEKSQSMMVAFLFIFFPTHDSTTYSYNMQYNIFSIAIYLYAYYHAHNNNNILAALLSFLASFLFYGSPPVAFALFSLFVLNRSYLKGFILWIPNIIYSIYYITIAATLLDSEPRYMSDFNLLNLAGHFIIQILSLIDAFIGPSFYFKLYYSVKEISIISFIIAVLFIFCYQKITRGYNKEEEKPRFDKYILISFGLLTFGALAIYSQTGGYPQIAFNLGNRTTTFGSLLLAYVIVIATTRMHINMRRIILIIVLFAIVGISTHWKLFHTQQKQLFRNIENNNELMLYNKSEPVLVSGNQYTKMGPFSHIEFLSPTWTANSIFNIISPNRLYVIPISENNFVKDNKIIHKKYNYKVSLREKVTIYDSVNNKLLTVNREDVNSYIETLPVNRRHWVQYIDSHIIKGIVSHLMPGLSYYLTWQAGTKHELRHKVTGIRHK